MKFRLILWSNHDEGFAKSTGSRSDSRHEEGKASGSRKWAVLLGVTLALVLLLSPFASQSPDGLQRVAENAGFSGKAERTKLWSPLAHYQLPGIANHHLAVILSGLIGGFLLFLTLYTAASWLEKRERNKREGA